MLPGLYAAAADLSDGRISGAAAAISGLALTISVHRTALSVSALSEASLAREGEARSG